MAVFEFELGHGRLFLFVDIERFLKAVRGLDGAEPRLHSHELVTCLHFFFLKWILGVVLLLFGLDVLLPAALGGDFLLGDSLHVLIDIVLLVIVVLIILVSISSDALSPFIIIVISLIVVIIDFVMVLSSVLLGGHVGSDLPLHHTLVLTTSGVEVCVILTEPAAGHLR